MHRTWAAWQGEACARLSGMGGAIASRLTVGLYYEKRQNGALYYETASLMGALRHVAWAQKKRFISVFYTLSACITYYVMAWSCYRPLRANMKEKTMKNAIATATAIHSYSNREATAYLVPFKTKRRGVYVTRYRWECAAIATGQLSDHTFATLAGALARAERSPYLKNAVAL